MRVKTLGYLLSYYTTNTIAPLRALQLVFTFSLTGSFTASAAIGALNEVWYRPVDTEESQVLRFHTLFNTSAGTTSVITNTLSVTDASLYQSYGRRVTAFYQVGTVVVVSEHVKRGAPL